MAFGNSIKRLTNVYNDADTIINDNYKFATITTSNTNVESVDCKEKTKEVPNNGGGGREGCADKHFVLDKKGGNVHDEQFQETHSGNDIDSCGKVATAKALSSKRKRSVKDIETVNEVKKSRGRQGGKETKQQKQMKTRAVIPSRVAINYDNILTIVKQLAKHMVRINKTLDKMAEKFDITIEGKIVVSKA